MSAWQARLYGKYSQKGVQYAAGKLQAFARTKVRSFVRGVARRGTKRLQSYVSPNFRSKVRRILNDANPKGYQEDDVIATWTANTLYDYSLYEDIVKNNTLANETRLSNKIRVKGLTLKMWFFRNFNTNSPPGRSRLRVMLIERMDDEPIGDRWFMPISGANTMQDFSARVTPALPSYWLMDEINMQRIKILWKKNIYLKTVGNFTSSTTFMQRVYIPINRIVDYDENTVTGVESDIKPRHHIVWFFADEDAETSNPTAGVVGHIGHKIYYSNML